MLNAHKLLNKQSIRQFSKKAGKLIIKYPFWILVIGSLGIHAAFMVLIPNPLKKVEEPREVIVPTLNLPPKQIASTNAPTGKNNKSFLDNLFIKPTTKSNLKSDLLTTTSPSSSDFSFSSRPDNFSVSDNTSPIDNSLFLNNPQNFSSSEFNNSPSVAPKNQTTTTPKSTNADKPITDKPDSDKPNSDKIDNTTANKNPNSNLKPELQGNNLKTEISSNSDNKNSDTSKTTKNTSNAKTTSNVSKSIVLDKDEKASNDLTIALFTDPDVLAKGQVARTLIPPVGITINEDKREKGVDWIPPKVAKVAGKSGTVTYAWLVAPDGTVTKKFVELKKTVAPELVEIVRETVKGYKFKPLANPQSGKYRLISTQYIFP